MSVFSKIKLSRKAAKEHKAQVAEKQKATTVETKVAYKHTPTHAAVDALSGAPSSWKNEDRPKIREHHKRRSQMAISRTGSSLSTASYLNPTGSSTPVPPLPRNSSYSSYNPTWNDRTGDVLYSTEPKFKGRHHSYQDSGIGASIGPSPLASHVVSERNSPIHSSGNSTSSSSDNLEMRVSKKEDQHSERQQTKTYADRDIFQRLHTSTTRKVGEAPILSSTPPSVQLKATATVVAQEQQKHKSRWSVMGKRNRNAIAAA